MSPFIAQLTELCATHVTRSKWVFVPSHAIGHTIGERLARNGTNWLNLRFVTPLDIALRMSAPFLVERGVDPSEEGLGPALMMRLLMDLPGQGGYFRPLANHPTLAEALWATIRELRMAGIRARDLHAGAFASAEKHQELRGLLEAYERFLETSRRGDMALVYEEAVRHPEWCPIQGADCWTELPDVPWTPVQRRLMEQLPGEHVVPRADDLPHVKFPRRLAGARADRVAPDPASRPLTLLMSPRAGVPVERIDMFRAGGREAEVEEVFRRILASGGRLDEVDIACASEPYLPLVWEKALRHEWPVTLGPGIAAAQTRPGRALLAFCGWIESDFAAGFMRRLLQSGDIRVAADDLTAGQAARLLFRAQAGWGRHTYDLSLQRMLRRSARELADADLTGEERQAAGQRIARLEQLRSWLNELIASVPQPAADGTVDLQVVVEAALGFLDRCAARSSALDAAARSTLRDAIVELRALGAVRASLLVALRFIRERVEGIAVAADRPRAGHLHVSMLADAGLAGRPQLFVVGLEEGRVFPAAVEDPILLDAERGAISPLLRLSSDRVDEAVSAALGRLASFSAADTGSRVCFSYSSRDTREYRETFASWLMLQVFRLRTGQPHASYPDLKAALGVPRSAVPDSPAIAASDAGWWLGNLKKAEGDGLSNVLRAFPHLARGRAAEAARESDTFTIYDGFVPEAGTALDPCRHDHLVSPTRLEEAAECPFRHFLRFGLGLRAVEDTERDRDVWLDPLTRGAELHDLYAALLRRCRDDDRRPDMTRDCGWLLDAARTRLQALRREMPPPSEEVAARETEDLLADLELFVQEECRGPAGRLPVGLEVSFGRELDEEVEALAHAEPIMIPIGDRRALRVGGRIDRIDQVAPGKFEIVDYKTGGYFEDDWRGTFAGGTRLQHALYAVAAAELLEQKYGRASVTGGVYYFSSARGRQERVTIATPPAAALRAVLGTLREIIASGTFVHAAAESACKWCDFGNACGTDVFRRAGNKLGDKKLATYLRLTQHD